MNGRAPLAAFASIVPAALLATRHGVDAYLAGGIVTGALVGTVICLWRSRAAQAG